MSNIKQHLALVFDDNLRTVKWKNIVDYTIIGLIALSTIEIYLSTFDWIVERYSFWLRLVNLTTAAIFTVEVTLRIWCADLLDEKYKGFKGRIRYCLSFYGLVDVLSTYTFFVALVLPIPFTTLKALRTVRLIRFFRYLKAFNILSRAISSKKKELLVSLQFLVIVTLLLSFVLFFVEHKAQPEVYKNGWVAVLWTFMQYVGDQGYFANDTPPITFWGHVISVIIGLLAIAIFAVPAGLIGSAFSDVMDEDKHKENCKKWREELHNAFERKLDRLTQYQIVPRYMTIADIQAGQWMKVDEIMDAIEASDDCRLINLASTIPMGVKSEDQLAVEVFPVNRSYGCCIDRGSKVTIINNMGWTDAITNWASFYLAKFGGFNYVSVSKREGDKNEFLDDLRGLATSDDCWVIPFFAASGADEPAYPTEIHWTYGAKIGDNSYDDPNITIHDIESFDNMQKAMGDMLKKVYDLDMDCQLYHSTYDEKFLEKAWTYIPNTISLRMAWSVICWDSRTVEILESMAKMISQHLESGVEKALPENMKTKAIAFDDELL